MTLMYAYVRLYYKFETKAVADYLFIIIIYFFRSKNI